MGKSPFFTKHLGDIWQGSFPSTRSLDISDFLNVGKAEQESLQNMIRGSPEVDGGGIEMYNKTLED